MKITIEQYVKLSRYFIETKYNKSYHKDKFEYFKKKLSLIITELTDGKVQIYFCYTAQVNPEIIELNNQVYIIFDLSLFVMFSELYTLRLFKYRAKIFNMLFFYYNKYLFALAEGEKGLAEYLLGKVKDISEVDLFSTKMLYNEMIKEEGTITISIIFVLLHELGHYIFEVDSKKSMEIKEKMFEHFHISYEALEDTVESLNITKKEYKKIKTFKNGINYKESICDIWAFVALKCGFGDVFSEKKIVEASFFALSNLFYIKYIQEFIFEPNFVDIDNRLLYLSIYMKRTCIVKVDGNKIKIKKHRYIYRIYERGINKYFFTFLEGNLGHIYREYYNNYYERAGSICSFYGSLEEAIVDTSRRYEL